MRLAWAALGIAITVVHGLLAGPAAQAQTILIYDDNSSNMRAIDAATRLGLTFTRARSPDFVTTLSGSRWDLVVMDMPSNEPTGDWQTALVDHIRAGGRAIHTMWFSSSLGALGPAFEVTVGAGHDGIPFYRWNMDTLFTTPQVVPNSFTMLTDLWGTNGFYLEPTGTARAAAGFVMSPTPNQAAIVVGNSGRTIWNGFLFDDYGAFDTDTDGIPDITELVMNEIALLAAVFPMAPCVGMPEGAACMASPGGPGICRGGVCCFGCWSGTRCERGTSGSQCGVGGASCTSCADGMPCTLDVCTTGACSNPMAPSGTTCDDGMYCTATDTCNAMGVCGGTGNPCSDGMSCTMDVCAETTDSCTFPPVTSSCTIGGACVGEGMVHPGYPCLECDPARSTTDWSPRAEGAECGPPRCTAGRLRTSTCDAMGGCVMAAGMICPTGMCLDASSCEPGCTDDSCAEGERCDPATMRCVPLLAGGAACDVATECASGRCVDGVCCTSACDGVCERCDAAGAMGECQPIPALMDPDMECATACDGAGACMAAPDAGPTDAGPGDAGSGDAGPARDSGGGVDAGGGTRTRGGCGCRAAGADADGSSLLLLVVVAGALVRRMGRRNRL